MNSPARVSRRKVRPRFSPLVLTGRPVFLQGDSLLSGRTTRSPPGFRLFSPPFRGAFQLSLTVLVRYRSRDVFSLGSWCLPASHGKTKPWYSGYRSTPSGLRLRGCHPLRRSLPAHFGFPGEGNDRSCNPTFPQTLRLRVQFGLSPVRSPLLRGSLLVSSPPPTKMFPLGGFPLGTPMKVSRASRVNSPW